MEFEIKKLTPELAEDYLRFFDETPHDDGADEHKCYCICWSSADHATEHPDFSTVEKRREAAGRYIREEKLQGYLAYLDGNPVGWCNANTKGDCLRCESWLRSMGDVPVDAPDMKVKSVFCFVIAPQFQRKGIATKLLERVCSDARAEGYSAVEGYPRREFISIAEDFMGPAAMYERMGFRRGGLCRDGSVAMRLELGKLKEN